MSLLVIGAIAAVAILILVTQKASAEDVICPIDSGGTVKLSLSDAATKIATAMAGFETGTMENFDPYDSTVWKGQAQKNNNPGNIRNFNGVMNQYTSPDAGFEAMIRDIESKIQGRTVTKLNSSSSISDLVNVWAPPSENSPASIDNYVSFVAQQVGVAPDAPFNSFIEGV